VLFILGKAIIIVGFIKWMRETNDPLQCAGIYTGGAFLGSLPNSFYNQEGYNS
jgi:hypothetical protein